ncbi:MAG: ATP-dependent RecD-like DNA helicase, partial [Prevotella sp.]|nr:ATP-dependent RecD-like DNA helicase [Prevotella sp.]
FTEANTKASKFDRVIAFSKFEILDNYAVRFIIHKDRVKILDKWMTILVIDKYEVSIRPCEWENFAKIFGLDIKVNALSREYSGLMWFLTNVQMSLTELVETDQEYYENLEKQISRSNQPGILFQILNRCRDIIKNEKPGKNVLRYLLFKMNNSIIKRQLSNEPCEKLSSLYLGFKCIPFEKMPYCTSLSTHNPRIYDLLESIPEDDREYELFVRFITNNTEIDGKLFTPISDIKHFDNIERLVSTYNNRLYYKHENRKLKEFRHHLYIKGYVDDCVFIIRRIRELSSFGVNQYTASVDSWMERSSYIIDDEDKKNILRQMFASSCVAIIYGSAGTGKSTLISHIANFWADKRKIFLANTHPAVDNLRRRVTSENSKYKTIAKFLSDGNTETECDILIIDECSTVSNADMKKVLRKATFRLLVLVGDTYQIESIYFGNWFSIARKFIPENAVSELTRPYRTTNNDLITLWNQVRNLEDSILELLIKNNYVARLDESIFEHTEDNEIILCLNYDGLYGINNINRFLQSNNPNPEVVWGINTYKVGDPILFNETNIFAPLIYNNSKGKIVGITPEDTQITFDIELDKSINEVDAWGYRFELIGVSENGNSVISFTVAKHRSTDEDDDINNSTVVPFQVSYAISIHKAQGLEYDSVKIVITNEVEERITHNIFYTAITRAKRNLKIYWSPETGQSVLENMKIKDSNKDAYLLQQIVAFD